MTASSTSPTSHRAPALRAELAAAALAIMLLAGPAVERARGYGVYHGLLSVAGRIDGHGYDLPPAALRCAGCHNAAQGAGDLRHLTQAASRRGGPPIAYTQESFCATLETGVDPAAVTLEHAMPRFRLTEGACRALWLYLGGAW